MNCRRITVLLIGYNAVRPDLLWKWLSDRSCHCQFVASFDDACKLMSEREFDLVLCEYHLPDRTAFPLLDWLEGGSSTVLFASRDGRSSRWLPVIERGKRSLNQQLLRTTDLPKVLANMLDGNAESDSMENEASQGKLDQVGVA